MEVKLIITAEDGTKETFKAVRENSKTAFDTVGKSAVESAGVTKSAFDSLGVAIPQSANDIKSKLTSAFDTLGIKSASSMQEAKDKINSAFNQIKDSGVATAEEITRAEAARATAIEDIDKQNFVKRKGLLDSFKDNWIKITAIIASAAWLKSAMNDALEAEKAFNKLRIQIEGMGKAYDSVSGQVEKAIETTSRYAIVQEEDVAKTLQELIFSSGNLDESMKRLNLTYDLAYQKGVSTSEAASMIGKAITGNVEMLGRYIPELRNLEETLGKNATKAQKTAYTFAILEEKSAGALDKMTEHEKRIAEMTKTWNDLKQIIGGIALEIANITVLKPFKSIKEGYAGLKENLSNIWNSFIYGQEEAKKMAKAAKELSKETEKLSDVTKTSVDSIVAQAKAQSDAIEIEKEQKEAIDKAGESLSKYSDAITKTGSEVLKFAEADLGKNFESQKKSISGMEGALKQYLTIVNEVYTKQIEGQKAIESAMKSIKGMDPKEIKNQSIAVLEAEKAQAEARLGAWTNYYSAIKSLHSSAIEEQKKKTQELLVLEEKIKLQRQGYTEMERTLQEKLWGGENTR